MHRCQSIRAGISYQNRRSELESAQAPSRACPQPSPHRRMPLMSSLNSSRQPHQHDGSSSEFQDQLGDPHNGREASTSSTNQQVPPNLADPACPGSLRPSDPSFNTNIDPPSLDRLIRSPFATHERIFLIRTIFSNRDEVEVVRRLCGEDAQTFVDVVYEVCSYIISPPKNGSINFKPKLRSLRR